MKRPTVKDLATHTGLSPATIDRVLHERSGVSPRAQQKVRHAIHALGYGRLADSLAETPRPALRFAILLPSLKTGFVRSLEAALRAASTTIRHAAISVDFYWTSLAEEDVAHAMFSVAGYDGVAMFAMDTPHIRAQIDRMVDCGVPLVTLVSDCPSSRRVACVGTDNLAAGRTVGRLMGRFLRGISGRIGVVTGDMTQREHEERYQGFREVLSRDFTSLKILPLIETHSIAARNRDAVLGLLRDHHDLVGLYSAAGGNSGVLAALNEAPNGQRPVVLLHEVTEAARRGLLSGHVDAVVEQSVRSIARQTLRLLTAHCLGDHEAQVQEQVPIGIVLPENLP